MAKTLLVVGSVALDTVQTPFGRQEDILGGSATYFSYAASFYAPVRLVSVVGEDFPAKYRHLLEGRHIDTSGLKTTGGKTFHWEGSYEGRMNVAKTIEVNLNVLGDFNPDLSPEFQASQLVFLANGSPEMQSAVLGQIRSPELAVADTMNCWIETTRDELLALLSRLDGLVLNDQEARMLTRCDDLLAAGKEVLGMGPRFAVIKKGEHGALLITADDVVALPAYPCKKVVDPTGAGDSFAGGMMGYLATQKKCGVEQLKSAIAHGIITASFAVEDFSLERFQEISTADIEQRLDEYKKMLRF